MAVDPKAYQAEQTRITENQLKEMVLWPDRYSHLQLRYSNNAARLVNAWKPNCKVLDIGCRTGSQLAFLHSCNTVDGTEMFKPENLYGIDICCEALEIFKKSGQGFNVVLGDMHDMPFNDKMFKIVIANQVIEHAHDPQQVVDEIWRVLEPGGRLIADVPCQRTDSYENRKNDAGHLQFFENPDTFYWLFKEKFNLIDRYFEPGRWSGLGDALILRLYGGVFEKV